MIAFGTNKTKAQVRQMWQTVFGDSNEYLNIYFSQKYKNDNTLIYFEGNQAVASLQMWEYKFSFYDKEIPIYYLAGLATYEEHRRKGYMTALIERAHEVMKERNIMLSVLIPAEEWLFNYYERYGYAQVFFANRELIPVQRILKRHETLEASFETFSRIYNSREFTILKSLEQFKTIVEEQKISNFEDKTDLNGVARIINVDYLLRVYAKNNPDKKLTIRVKGDTDIEANNGFYTIEEGRVSKFPNAIADFQVDIMEICELLMGIHSEQFSAKLVSKFPKHHPTMNLMLE